MILEKYSGSGNDFLITHLCEHDDLSTLAKNLCHRHLGIGADGFITLKPHATHAYAWEFFNSDGTRASMCGNASRCVAHYAHKRHLAPRAHTFWAGKRAIEVEVREGDSVRSHLGKHSPIETLELQTSYGICAYLTDTGVPHLVIFTQDSALLPLRATEELRALRERFDANVNIVHQKDSRVLEVHTYERGVEGITLACGTGMGAASAVASSVMGLGDSYICIPPSGEELIFDISEGNVSFEGAVRHIATCII